MGTNENTKKFCMKCGAELEPDAVFCSSCGTKQDEPPQIQSGRSEKQLETQRHVIIQNTQEQHSAVLEQQFCCPQCHSENIQSYQMIYSQNVSTTNNTTTGVAVGYSGGFGVGVGGANTTGVSVTNLGQSVAPPSYQAYNSSGCLWAILIVISMGASMAGGAMSYILPVVLIGGYIAYGYKKGQEAKKWNQEVYPQLLNKWQHSYMCMKCGNRFIL